ncbi:hypothetical protein AUJ83_02470 [Candidatus Woesearchaeota archaeon CG1_02_33_12]|nr:MAG: hypothetical protein AUJ83_02470 [Candidatus Woesearchaeota archaeon CG1_02_33_12]PIN78397.1 MAG: hypothetical protein COV14_03775 [Candidatus Woesearchaeota archaeon CG10_big_fil_rev_8_21_14_0_10_33_12]PIU72448.1 MAG: hypothetical protein COS79_02920 [Candidatus Woesearchaeota archaeon CG06_land_8_20_14_3_00_33_13]
MGYNIFKKYFFEEYKRTEFNKKVTIENFGSLLHPILGPGFSGSCIPPTQNSKGSALMVYDLGKRGIVLFHSSLEFNPTKKFDYSDYADSYIKKIHIHTKGPITDDTSTKQKLDSILEQFI